MRRRTIRGVAWEISLVLLLIGALWLLAATGALAEFGRWFGEMMADRMASPMPQSRTRSWSRAR